MTTPARPRGSTDPGPSLPRCKTSLVDEEDGTMVRRVKYWAAAATLALLVAASAWAAVVVLGAPIAARTQARQAQAPKAKVRELATIEGDVGDVFRLPG